jgi:hypothetical protein
VVAAGGPVLVPDSALAVVSVAVPVEAGPVTVLRVVSGAEVKLRSVVPAGGLAESVGAGTGTTAVSVGVVSGVPSAGGEEARVSETDTTVVSAAGGAVVPGAGIGTTAVSVGPLGAGTVVTDGEPTVLGRGPYGGSNVGLGPEKVSRAERRMERALTDSDCLFLILRSGLGAGGSRSGAGNDNVPGLDKEAEVSSASHSLAPQSVTVETTVTVGDMSICFLRWVIIFHVMLDSARTDQQGFNVSTCEGVKRLIRQRRTHHQQVGYGRWTHHQ